MKKTILFLILILASMAFIGCQTAKTTESTQETTTEEGAVVPDITLNECLTQIKETNPEMSDQDAKDNCYAVEAINKQDKSLCQKISNGNIKSACLNQF